MTRNEFPVTGNKFPVTGAKFPVTGNKFPLTGKFFLAQEVQRTLEVGIMLLRKTRKREAGILKSD